MMHLRRTMHTDEGIRVDEHRTEERLAQLERRLDALEETVRSLALEVRALYEAADVDDEL
jgi:hypothetical protein